MKRIILASVSTLALFSATGALAAGSNSSVSQSGTLQGAVVHQEGATGASSTVTQSGADNAFNILQEGNGNKSTATQIGSDVPASNSQDTSGNYIANTASKSNFGNVIQRGLRGTSTIDQTSNNDAIVEQTADSSDSTSSITQRQLTNGNSIAVDYHNRATVLQQGNGVVTINQLGGNPNSASNGNTASATQTVGAINASSIVVQTGARNSATTLQSGNGAYSYVQQGGATVNGDNVANITQDGDSDSYVTQDGGDNSSATVDQRGGSFNLSVIEQRKATGPVLSTADVGQVGSDNRSYLTQRGQGASATVRQTQTIGASNGDRSNLSSIDQVAYSTATVNQTGDENDSSVTQGSTALETPATGSTANVKQNGQHNVSGVTQSAAGTANIAIVNQVGSVSQVSYVTQNSNNSTATVTQSASSNQSYATQDGDQQTLLVSQSALGNFSSANQAGDDNYASVSQQTIGNSSTIGQSGSFNTAFVTQ